ncbi:MAG: ribonuclease J [Desulfobacterales bacterium]
MAKLRIIPLGGLGEIGLNMMVFEYGEAAFIVDAGLMFPEDYMLGVDYVIPRFDYLQDNRQRVCGIILTHAHEDHIGALPFLLKEMDIPVFGTAFTLGMVRHKLEDHGLLAASTFHEINPRDRVKLGRFDIECIRVNHSVVDGIALAIRTPVGTVLHTGDFKISQNHFNGMVTDVGRFAQLGDEGVLALLSDSTNVEREGYTISDHQIGTTLAKICEESQGRIIVALFASSIVRIQQIVDIAAARGSRLVISGRSIENSVKVATQLGLLKIPAGIEIALAQVNSVPDRNLMILTTGTQGEPMSALARMAAGHHKQVRIKAGDTVILSSKFIPGNERAITKIINNLYKLGADVVYEKISDIHVSGHAFQEELKFMINLVRPRYFIPIHGEYRHLVLHSRLARQMNIPNERVLLAEDGQIIEFDDQGGRIRGEVATGRVLIDGKGIGDVGRSVLQERRDLGEDGMVAVTLAFDEETGVVVYGPEIVSRGFIFEHHSGYLLEDAVCVVLEVVEEVGPDVPRRLEKIRSRLKTALRQYLFLAIGRRPVILPFVLEV